MTEFSQVDEVLGSAIDRGDVPGVVAMAAARDEVVYQGAFGRRALADEAAMSTDTVFWIASMTKAITSTAAMQLVEEGKLIYAGRAGTGMPEAELERLWQRLQPLAAEKMPLAIPPPRGSRFGSPLALSRVHWVRPEMVVEVSYVEWTPDGLLRHVVYLGERQDKLASEVRRSPPHSGETQSR